MKYRVKFGSSAPGGARDEEIEARNVEINGDWMDFVVGPQHEQVVVARLRQKDIERVDRVTD